MEAFEALSIMSLECSVLFCETPFIVYVSREGDGGEWKCSEADAVGGAFLKMALVVRVLQEHCTHLNSPQP